MKKSYRLSVEGIRQHSYQVCSRSRGDPSDSFWDISVRTEALDRPTGSKRLEQLEVFKSDVTLNKMQERASWVCYTSVCQGTGCTPDEQMLQLLLVTHINREQMATQVARERERERGCEHEPERITGTRRDGDWCLCKWENLPENTQAFHFTRTTEEDWTSPLLLRASRFNGAQTDVDEGDEAPSNLSETEDEEELPDAPGSQEPALILSQETNSK